MTCNTKKPKVEIVPVSWTGENNEIVLKYQAKATLVRPNEDVKVLTGEPSSTKQAALESLNNEVIQRQEDIARIIDVLENFVV